MIHRIKSQIVERKELTKDVILLKFERPKEFDFKAGQFVNIRIRKNDLTRMRAYSILNPPEENSLDICLKIVKGGFASEVFEKAKVGDEFEIVGPFGYFVFEKDFSKHEFICAGTGIVPFYSMIKEHITDKSKSFRLVVSYKTKEDLLFHEELIQLEKDNSNFGYVPTLTRDSWNGDTGRVQNHIELEKDIYYICGLRDLVLDTKEYLIKKEIKEEKIRVERYN